jgi:hypothetical protein
MHFHPQSDDAITACRKRRGPGQSGLREFEPGIFCPSISLFMKEAHTWQAS